MGTGIKSMGFVPSFPSQKDAENRLPNLFILQIRTFTTASPSNSIQMLFPPGCDRDTLVRLNRPHAVSSGTALRVRHLWERR